MKRILIAAALALSGCAQLGIPASPSDIANKTTLDEKGAIGVEASYKAARTVVEFAVDTGLLKGASATKAAALDTMAYTAVTKARAAYEAGNAASYPAAVNAASAAIADMLSNAKGN